ncbi:MAG: hypothetical protein CBC02_008330 [Flavobacteriaceae bacterium TMED42]|nr:MAG: hypothetical protein CBC02_008330 [Flavobacteriaceae bacterium TMED42]|tara:strand:- start:48 stop:350 length:303 start_codon:yes stop_codon:yes gene_type:complete
MNLASASGKRRGSSGFIRPEFYSQYKKYKGEVCRRNLGFTLVDYADKIEELVTSGDYRLFYKHFYYADENKQLKFKTEGGDEYIIDKKDFNEEEDLVKDL